MSRAVRSLPSLDALTEGPLRSLKCAGFSDLQLARYTNTKELEVSKVVVNNIALEQFIFLVC